jgi:hypothetical protein
MVRSIAAIVAGVVTWFAVATLGNFILRAALPGYAAVEMAMDFTLDMQFARLALGAISSLCAGFIAAWIAAQPRRAVAVLTALLLVLFLPVHYSLWLRFPVWYHAAFLLSLVIVPALGAWLRARVTDTRRDASA